MADDPEQALPIEPGDRVLSVDGVPTNTGDLCASVRQVVEKAKVLAAAKPSREGGQTATGEGEAVLLSHRTPPLSSSAAASASGRRGEEASKEESCRSQMLIFHLLLASTVIPGNVKPEELD